MRLRKPVAFLMVWILIVLHCSSAVLAAPAAERLYPPSSGEIMVNNGTIEITPSASGTFIEVANGRTKSAHTYNMNNLSIIMNQVDFTNGDELQIALGKAPGEWYDGHAMMLVFLKNGEVRVTRGGYQIGTPFVKEHGFDFSDGVIAFSLVLNENTFTLTVNGKATTFNKSYIQTDIEGGLNLSAAYLAFGGDGIKLNVASIVGGAPGSTMEVVQQDFTPTPPDKLVTPPSLKEIKQYWGTGMTITPGKNGTMIEIPDGRASTAHVFDINNGMSVVINNIDFGADSDDNAAVALAFVGTSGAWHDNPAFIFSFTKGGVLNIAKGPDGAFPSPFRTITGFDFRQVIEMSIRLDGDDYLVIVNGIDIRVPTTDVESIFNAGTNKVDPTAAALTFSKAGTTNTVKYNVANFTGAQKYATIRIANQDFTPTPTTDLPAAPAVSEIKEFSKANKSFMQINASETGTLLTMPRGTAGTVHTYSMDNLSIVINKINFDEYEGDDTAVTIGFVPVAGAEDNASTLTLSFTKGGVLRIYKGVYAYLPGNIPIPFESIYYFDFSQTIEINLNKASDGFNLEVNGTTIFIPYTELEGVLANKGGKLNPDSAYIIFSKTGTRGVNTSYNIQSLYNGEKKATAGENLAGRGPDVLSAAREKQSVQANEPAEGKSRITGNAGFAALLLAMLVLLVSSGLVIAVRKKKFHVLFRDNSLMGDHHDIKEDTQG